MANTALNNPAMYLAQLNLSLALLSHSLFVNFLSPLKVLMNQIFHKGVIKGTQQWFRKKIIDHRIWPTEHCKIGYNSISAKF